MALELERLIALFVVTVDLSFVLLRDIWLGPSRRTRNLESGPIGRLENESATHVGRLRSIGAIVVDPGSD